MLLYGSGSSGIILDQPAEHGHRRVDPALLGLDDAQEEPRLRLARALAEQRIELRLRAVELPLPHERRRLPQTRVVLLARLRVQLAVVLRERGRRAERNEQDERAESAEHRQARGDREGRGHEFGAGRRLQTMRANRADGFRRRRLCARSRF